MKVAIVLALLGCSVGAAQEAPTRLARLAIPGVTGVLEIDVGGKFQTRVRPDGKEVQLRAMERTDGLAITAFLQRVDFPATAERCRAEWWPGTRDSLKVQRDDLRESSATSMVRIEYIIPEFQGVKVQQKNVHAYLGTANLCAEIHLSKTAFKLDDQKLFEAVLNGAKLLPTEVEPNTLDETQPEQPSEAGTYFAQGSKLYLEQNYSAAAGVYQKALDLEKQKHTFSQTYFRVLVDNLGMAYGISGDIPRAKETFEYGISQDPEYPMFYYNMACVYGEMGKMQEAISQLQLAYKYKANGIPGEGLPDPMRDDSFRYFVDNQKFVDAVREMQK